MADRRIAIAYGPVEDPKGVYGLGIIETEDWTIARDIRVNDPTIKSDAGDGKNQRVVTEGTIRPPFYPIRRIAHTYSVDRIFIGRETRSCRGHHSIMIKSVPANRFTI